MMQSKEIVGLMKGKSPYTAKTLSSLSDLIDKYPYFQTARLLHTLNLLHLQDTHFLIDLRKTAVYLSDRKRLFFLIKDSSFIQEQIDTFEQETRQSEASFELIDNFLSESIKETVVKIGETIEIEEAAEIIPISTEYTSTYIFPENEDNEEAPPLQHQETIDKFLEQDAISPLRIKFDKTNKADKQEVEVLDPLPESISEEGFFSETLAKIYIKQKQYGKALEIINKLNLIYPEKSRYFAEQIRFLEKLIINTNKNK